MKKTRDTKSILLRVLLYLFVILVVLVTLYPYFVMFTTKAVQKFIPPMERSCQSTGCGKISKTSGLWLHFRDTLSIH